MSLLDLLWDDTVASPRPDNGLGRLRKFRTFDLPSDSGKESYGGNLKSFSKAEDAIRVTRSIMIVKPPRFDNQHGSLPSSPAGSTPPTSPFSEEKMKDHFDSAGGQHPMHTRDPARLDEEPSSSSQRVS